MSFRHPLSKTVAWAIIACLVASCASIKTVDPAAPLQDREIDDEVVLHLRGGETLTTNRVSVTDTTFVLHTLVEDGKERNIDPMVIRRVDVESMTRIRPRWPVIIGVAVLVTVPLVLLIDAFSGWNMGS